MANGQARLLSEDQQTEILGLLRANPKWTLKQAAEKIGMHKRDARRTMAEVEGFSDGYRDVRGWGDEAIRGQIFKLAFHRTNPNPRLLLAMARAYLPEYQDRRDVNITHQAKPFIDFSKLTLEQARLLRDLLALGAPENGEALPADAKPALELVAAVIDATDDEDEGEDRDLA